MSPLRGNRTFPFLQRTDISRVRVRFALASIPSSPSWLSYAHDVHDYGYYDDVCAYVCVPTCGSDDDDHGRHHCLNQTKSESLSGNVCVYDHGVLMRRESRFVFFAETQSVVGENVIEHEVTGSESETVNGVWNGDGGRRVNGICAYDVGGGYHHHCLFLYANRGGQQVAPESLSVHALIL